MTIRRRVAGLRREEVAELVGVSPNWYALFEAGKADRRFSAAFVQRVAEALRLDERERGMLFRLALPEIRFAVEQFERSTHDGAIRDLQSIRTLVRRVTAANTFAEAAEAAVNAVFELLSPSSVATAILAPSGGAGRIISAGPRADTATPSSGIVDTCIVANYPNRYGHTTYSENRPAYPATGGKAFAFEQRTVEGASFHVKVADSAPFARDSLARTTATGPRFEGALSDVALRTVEYWGWNSGLSVCSTMTHGLFSDGSFRGNLCALWAEPREMSPLDVEIVRIASAIVELAVAPSPSAERAHGRPSGRTFLQA